MRKLVAGKLFAFTLIILGICILPARAEEEIGLVQRLWRNLFKKEATIPTTRTEIPKPKQDIVPEEEGESSDEAEDILDGHLTLKELEAIREREQELKRQKEQAELLNNMQRMKSLKTR